MSLFDFAFDWRARPHIPDGALPFTIHQRSGIAMLFGVLAGATLVEAAVVHQAVTRWSTPAAWVLTAVSLYAAVWLTAVARSFALLPVLLIGETLWIRRGLLVQARSRSPKSPESRKARSHLPNRWKQPSPTACAAKSKA